jgi:hypothetical protein
MYADEARDAIAAPLTHTSKFALIAHLTPASSPLLPLTLLILLTPALMSPPFKFLFDLPQIPC